MQVDTTNSSLHRRCIRHRLDVAHWLLWDRPQQPNFPRHLHTPALGLPRPHGHAGVHDVQAENVQPRGESQLAVVP